MALVWAVLLATAGSWTRIGAGLALACGLVAVSGIGWTNVLGRLRELNLFMLMVLLFVPFSMPGEPLFGLGPLTFSQEGLLFAASVALKGNAIVIILTVLLNTIETVTLGHALSHLKVPDKLIQLFLFTVRYIDVLHHEYRTLATAMKVRGFRPGLNGHTLKTYANLVAVLLIRSFDRSERIVAAMKCRGFRGRFYVLEHFHGSPQDAWMAGLAGVLTLGLVITEYL